MITREQLEEAFDENRTPFQTKGIDHDFRAIELLRKRIPYSTLPSIISGADHDIIYLCDVETAVEFLIPDDIYTLADCNVFIHKDGDCLALFV